MLTLRPECCQVPGLWQYKLNLTFGTGRVQCSISKDDLICVPPFDNKREKHQKSIKLEIVIQLLGHRGMMFGGGEAANKGGHPFFRGQHDLWNAHSVHLEHTLGNNILDYLG